MFVPTAALKPFVRPAVLGAALAAIAMPGAANAASVAPEYKAGNPSCESLGAGWTSILKDDKASGGPFSGNGWDITIDKNGASFDWDASKAVDAVIVKGGDNSNVYTYPGGSMGDTDLVAPLNTSTQDPTDTYGLSHIEFCDGPDAPPKDPDPEPQPQPQPEPQPQPQPQPEPQGEPQPEPQGEPQPEVVPAAANPAPQQFTAAQKAIPASARISAPRSCVKGSFKVSVTGRGMRSVTFYVNGKKVATKQGARSVSVRIPVSSSVHRISAKVRYVNGATKTTQTLRAAALRCVQRVVRPQFTG
jgi:hypothetical protein